MDTRFPDDEPWRPDQRALINLSQSISRRSALTRFGRILLGAAGVVVTYRMADVMTDDSPTEASHDSNPCNECSDDRNCGLCGVPCAHATCGGACFTCPAGTSRGTSYWTQCCFSGPALKIHRYYDCCRFVSGCTPSVHRCGGSSLFCSNNCPQPTWCPAGTNCYFCTVVSTGANC